MCNDRGASRWRSMSCAGGHFCSMKRGGSGAGMESVRAEGPAAAASPRLSIGWRRRFLYGAMSALLVWHTLAMVVAPAPGSDLTDGARSIMAPYLTLLGLDHGWSFFAPNVENGVIFRYEVEAPGGVRHIFTPSETLRWYHPSRRWTRDRFRQMLDEPERYADVVAAALCRDHAELKPVSVTLIETEQKDFSREDRLAGKTPLDPEFLQNKTVKQVSCPTP
jgi:hypothetical protein